MTLEELAANAGRRGFWMVYKSPFRPEDAHAIGFCPHGTTGWNGRPDICRTAAALEEVIREALKVLVTSKPGDLDS